MSDTVLAKWKDIKDDYGDCLLLGNGASISVDPLFDYRSLLEEARNQRLIMPKVDRVFRLFQTSDFEHVLNVLSISNDINRALHIKDRITQRVYNFVRETLIGIVRAIHPEEKDIIHNFSSIAQFLQHFSMIVSLNYDLILYWAILWANENNPSIKFKDCFPDGKFDNDWQKFTNPIGAEKKSIPIFYIHGNLVLTTDPANGERKIITPPPGQYLLSFIFDKWHGAKLSPLFVSEGTKEQKLAAIRLSLYLGTVYDDILPQVGESLVIYGSSLQLNDEHVLTALIKGGLKRIAISVYKYGNPNWLEACSSNRKRLQSIASAHKKSIAIIFFDAQSEGAWIY